MWLQLKKRKELKKKLREVCDTFFNARSDHFDKLSDEDKVPYEEQAEEDKQRYKKEMENYTPPSDDDSDSDDGGGKKKKAKRAKKDPNAPKKPLNAYMLYGNSVRSQIREENPDLSMPEVVSLMLWHVLFYCRSRSPLYAI